MNVLLLERYGKFYIGKGGVTKKITNFVAIGDKKKLGFLYNSAHGVSPQDDGNPET